MINETRREGDLFVKTRPGVHPDEYRAEAEGLRWLGEPGHLRTPRVVEVHPDRLVLEWIETGGALDEEALGRGLALTHAAGAPAFGWHHPIRFGRLTLQNAMGAPGALAASDASQPPAGAAPELSTTKGPDAFADFYGECRLRPFAERFPVLEGVIARLPELAGPEEPPARVHGDLWHGNVLATREGEPVLIDPAAHGGHREVDLAMLALFGGLSARTLAAYQDVAPLAEGWRDRVELWQLFPLLVHAELFGGGYVAQAERVARRYAGRARRAPVRRLSP